MGRELVRYCTAALVAALVLLVAAPVHAQAGTAGEAVRVCVRRAEPGLDVRALLRRPRGFDCATPQRAWGPGDYLVVSEPLRVGRHWPVHVRSGSLWQHRQTLYALYADGRVLSVRTDAARLSGKIQLGSIVEDVLPARDRPVVRLLWQVEGAANIRGIVLDPRVAKPSESGRSNTLLAALYAGFAGLCAALLIYNLALWGALRHRFQLAYCGMVLCLLVYAISSSGALAWLWPGLPNNDRLRINYLSLTLSTLGALAFARSFFEPRVFAGRLGRAADAVTVGLFGSAVLWAAFVDRWPIFCERLYFASYAALMLLIGPMLWKAWRTRSDYLWLFCVAWGAPILCGTLRIAGNVGLLELSFWLDNSTILAMVAEATLSTLAIAYRINLLSRERDRARLDEHEARLLADIDPLTGLLNRRAFLSRAIGRPGRQTLLVLDLDHFKRINETIGHDGGDEVLRLAGRLLRDSASPGALVARIGGEEFAVVADADADLDPALVLAGLRTTRMPYDVEVTTSIGVAQGPLSNENDWKLLYRRADQALFEAKASGRDRVRRALAIAA